EQAAAFLQCVGCLTERVARLWRFARRAGLRADEDDVAAAHRREAVAWITGIAAIAGRQCAGREQQHQQCMPAPAHGSTPASSVDSVVSNGIPYARRIASIWGL